MAAQTNGSRSKAAPRSKGAAARADKDGPKRIDFRGVELELPDVLPGTLYFDFADLSDNEDDPGAQMRLLKSLIGDEQVATVRQKVADDGVSFDEIPTVIIGLFESALAAYGSTVPESSASPSS